MKECEETAAVWQDDGHTDDSTDDWDDDGHTDDSTDDWDDDGHTDDSTDDNGSSWSTGYAFNSAKSSNNSASGGSSNGRVWGIAALVAGLVGIAAFVGMRKRKRSDEDNDRNIPEDVYVEGVNGLSEGDAASQREYEMKSVRSSTSRAQTIKSALSRGGASFKSKFSRNRSGNVGANQEPLAPMQEGGFEDETINTNDQEGGVMM